MGKRLFIDYESKGQTLKSLLLIIGTFEIHRFLESNWSLSCLIGMELIKKKDKGKGTTSIDVRRSFFVHED